MWRDWGKAAKTCAGQPAFKLTCYRFTGKALGALSSSIKQFRPASLARYNVASAASRTNSGVECRFDRSASPMLMLMLLLTLGACDCFVSFAD